MEYKFRKLRADEMECRIARITEKGVQLLLYKDARCDMNILDETVGSTNWQRRHTRDNANCIVSIWDDAKEQWIDKEDTGTESNTEKEKGLASDSFKRACFNWGIGRELYTAPFIWFPAEHCNILNKKCYDTFKVQAIGYDGNIIAELSVINQKTGAVFAYKNGRADYGPEKGSRQKRELQKEEQPAVSLVGESRKARLMEAFIAETKRTGIPVNYFLIQGKVNRVEDLKEAEMEAAIDAMKKKPAKEKKTGAN